MPYHLLGVLPQRGAQLIPASRRRQTQRDRSANEGELSVTPLETKRCNVVRTFWSRRWQWSPVRPVSALVCRRQAGHFPDNNTSLCQTRWCSGKGMGEAYVVSRELSEMMSATMFGQCPRTTDRRAKTWGKGVTVRPIRIGMPRKKARVPMADKARASRESTNW
jgi:hypothetical protein